MSAIAIFKTLIIQATTVGLFLFGMLLDPLTGLWVAFLYFLIAGTFFIYKYFENKNKK